MGKVIQRKNYVIIFNASSQTFEDMLLYFDCDIREIRLKEPSLPVAFENVIGVHENSLRQDLSFTQYFCIQNEKMCFFYSEKPLFPSIVHFLHFKKTDEIETHRKLSGKFSEFKTRMVNPYNSGTSNCDSKFRMYEVFKEFGISTPDSRLISRFNKRKMDSFMEIARDFSEAGLYVQPDRGTEGEGCFFLESNDYGKAAPFINQEGVDIVVRKKAGNTLYKGDSFVLRINVCFDREMFYADSGYCMVGGKVVSPSIGARKVNINEVLNYLAVRDEDISRIKETCCNATRAVFKDTESSLLIGVDVVLDKQDGYFPYIIDMNPRPVIVGSRIIGTNQIGLGGHFWRGVCY